MSAPQSSDTADIGRLILALGVAAFASQIGYRIADPVTPLIAGEFSVSIASAAALATAYAIPYGLIQPILGPVGDTFGKANLIRASIALLAASLIVSAVAFSFSMLVVARIAGGMAAGGIIPAAIAIVGDRVPLAERQVMLARMMAINYIGMVSGPAASGFVGSVSGWRTVFLVGALVIGASAVVVFLRLRPRQAIARQKFSLANIRGHYASVFSRRIVWPFFALTVLEGAASFAAAPYIADILARRSTAGTFEAGVVLACFGLGGILFTVMARMIVPRLGLRLQIQGGGLATAIALIFFSMSTWWQFDAAAFFVFGFGFLMLHVTMQTFATELTPDSRGSTMAMFAFVFFAGQAAGPILFGVLRGAFGDTATLLCQAATLAFVGTAASFLLTAGLRR